MIALSREPNPEQKRALKLWIASGRTMKPMEIADKIGVSAALVRKWKSLGKWNELPDKRRRGGQLGNKNSKGNKGGDGPPPNNDNAVKHGLYRKFMPNDEEMLEIYDSTAELSPIEMLWTSIRILWTNIIRAQKIMFVRDQKDQTKVLKKKKPGAYGTEQEWEYQHAWDKQGAALNAQSQAMNRLATKIKQYDDMLRSIPPEQVREEQRLRSELLKAQVKSLEYNGDGSDQGGLDQLADAIKKSAAAIRGE